MEAFVTTIPVDTRSHILISFAEYCPSLQPDRSGHAAQIECNDHLHFTPPSSEGT